MKYGLIYLASQYYDISPEVRDQRFRAAAEATAKLMNDGLNVFSPICHSHPIQCMYNLPEGNEFWLRIDFAILDRCDAMIVLAWPGWESSVGVKAEIKRCIERSTPVYYRSPAQIHAEGFTENSKPASMAAGG